MSNKRIVNDLVKVIRRLSLNESSMNFRYDNFKKTIRKIERMGGSFFDRVLLKRTDKEELSDYLEVNYYRGKIMAYLYILEQLVGVKKAYQLLY